MLREKRGWLAAGIALALALAVIGESGADNPAIVISVDANRSRRAINPDVYGLSLASPEALRDLNVPLNRQGGNAASRYNWQLNASNRAADWYFQSIGESSAVAGELGDTFIGGSRGAGAQPLLTIPMLDWVAKLGPSREKLSSFSIRKYGAQQDRDWQWFPDAGNGIRPDGTHITGNDPNDAHVRSSSLFQQGWVRHLVQRWGGASRGGLRYYILDNEPSIWHATHRDVHPEGARMTEVRDRMIDYAARIKAVDPAALTLGPEEWGWDGYRYSGYDQWYAPKHNWTFPDREQNGGWDYLPWLLDQLRRDHESRGRRLLDIFSVHYYPQGGEFWGGTDQATQLRRNRSTRSLWDPNYVDESWINDRVRLVPRLREWVNTYYPGTRTAITEYNWGAEGHINGATAQADILGIFGREGLDMATRWTTPAASTPTYKAIKMYRNYDGRRSTFGNTSIFAGVPNPDNVAAFAATRAADGSVTVMLISKHLSGNTPVRVNLANFAARGTAQVWQLTASNTITRLADLSFTGNSIPATLPAQSVTLLVVPALKVNCGGPTYASTIGTWLADAHFSGGTAKAYTARDIANTGADPLYLRQRSGPSFSYSLPVSNGRYAVKAYFAECEYAAPRQRRVNISVNGRLVLAGLDVYAASGGQNRAIARTFPVTVTGGRINLAFTSTLTGRNAEVAAIEVTPGL